MPRRAVKITQAEIARVIRAAEQAAPGRFVVEVDPQTGLIRAVPIDASQASGYAPAEPGAAPGCGLAGVL